MIAPKTNFRLVPRTHPLTAGYNTTIELDDDAILRGVPIWPFWPGPKDLRASVQQPDSPADNMS